jgi:predicted transcriptional regulator
MLKMDQVHVLRHKVLKEGQSIRRVARELGLSRNTVTKYLDQPEPVRSFRRRRERPVREAVKPRLEELVAQWNLRTTASSASRRCAFIGSSYPKANASAGRWWATIGASDDGNTPRFTCC